MINIKGKIEINYDEEEQLYCAYYRDDTYMTTTYGDTPKMAFEELMVEIDEYENKKVADLTVDIKVNVDKTDVEEAMVRVEDLGEAVKLATKNYEALIKKHKRYLDLAQTPIPYSPCPQITPPYRWHYTVPSSGATGDRYW